MRDLRHTWDLLISGLEKLKLTPLRIANIPPPMALHELSLEANIIDVAVSSPSISRSHASIAVLLPGKVEIYRWNLLEQKMQSPYLWTILSLDKSSKLGVLNRALVGLQVMFLGHEHLLILQSHDITNTLSIYKIEEKSFSLVNSTEQAVASRFLIDVSRTASMPYVCTLMYPNIQVLQLLGQFTDLLQGNWQEKAVLASFPRSTYQFEVVILDGSHQLTGSNLSANGIDSSSRVTLTFGLTINGSLFACERCIAKDCTSFTLTPSYLIFTTSQHLLKFVHLTAADSKYGNDNAFKPGSANPFIGLDIPPDTPELDERCRSIERGARIVTVIPSIFAVVLQMPRGNLETIYPRVLVLSGIRQQLDKRKYRKAFLACRNQRVDMNILHDHNPDEFIANVDLFVDQIGKVEYIDLFLSQLREEDVSRTMYKDTGKSDFLDASLVSMRNSPGTMAENTSKINRICDSFLVALKPRASTNLQNIISAHVCKSPPDLEAGLSVVANLQIDDPTGAELAVEHICFLADVNRLYDTALGLYNLELALLVAQQSQRDPREYLPFLQNLQEMSTLQRQFKIDDYLGRHKKALQHLHEMNVFEDFKVYAVKHTLYETALNICRYQEEEVKVIMRPYADFLQRGSNYKEAGIGML